MLVAGPARHVLTVLADTLQLKARANILFGGQLTGVEGYTESIATGLAAARNAIRLLNGLAPVVLPRTTMVGALIAYITSANPKNFQPINSNWGLFEVPEEWMKLDKGERRQRLAERALADMRAVAESLSPALST